MSKSRQLAFSIVACAGLLWIASPASAQPQEIVVTGKKVPEGYHAVKRTVSIKGLDLSTPAGAAEMEKRVATAVEWICQSHLAVGKEEQRDSKLCSDFAWASARPQMDRALHAARAH
jgi:UrcA family protein